MALINRVSPGRGPENPLAPRAVLSIDGGGIRGLVPAVALMNLEKEAGRPLYEVFDLIVGTSTGGILATAIGMGIPMETVVQLYHKEARRIFHAPWHWKLRRGFRLKAPKYPMTGLRETLIDYLGEHNGYGEMKTRVMVTAFATEVDRANDGGIDWMTKMAGDFLGSQQAVVEYINRDRDDIVRVSATSGRDESVALLKSYKRKHQGILAWQAAYATAAAPTYFPGIVLGNRSYFDGGVYAVNPTLIAEAEAEKLWPEAESINYASFASVGANPEVPMDETDPRVLFSLHKTGDDLWHHHKHQLVRRFIPNKAIRLPHQ